MGQTGKIGFFSRVALNILPLDRPIENRREDTVIGVDRTGLQGCIVGLGGKEIIVGEAVELGEAAGALQFYLFSLF